MINESYPWKRDLLRRKSLFLRYNTKEHFNKDEDATYTVLEKSIFYSAFIIRKLIDCGNKLSDDADNYRINVQKIFAKQQIYEFHRSPNEKTHDFSNWNKETALGKDVCNWLIHSYVFTLVSFDDYPVVDGFFVSSDKDRNKYMYYISIDEWMKFVDFIGTDYVVAIDSHYDEKKKDYVFTKKERGIPDKA